MPDNQLEPKVEPKVEPKPVTFSAENPPKSKEDWNQLRQADPVLFADLTQQNMDKTFREAKEWKEKYSQLETQKNNLTVELEQYKKKVVPEVPDDDGTKQPYSIHNLPKTKEEWADLMIDDPVLGTDLRTYYNNQTTQSQTKFQEVQASSRRTVQAEHPDMYIAELDSNGQPKKDSKGKVVLKVDEVSGEPIFNPDSEKGKLWTAIYNENPSIANNPHAPELLMATMERRLRLKGEEMVKDANTNREQQIQDGQVVQDGVTPPAPTVEVKFNSEEERIHAQGMVNRGLYKDLTDYVKNRDSKEDGYYEPNSEPVFKK